MMARIGQRNTAPEIAVRRILHRLGLRFRLRYIGFAHMFLNLPPPLSACSRASDMVALLMEPPNAKPSLAKLPEAPTAIAPSSSPVKDGTAAWSGSSPAAWWNGSTGPRSY